jgi:hypothetical protein
MPAFQAPPACAAAAYQSIVQDTLVKYPMNRVLQKTRKKYFPAQQVAFCWEIQAINDF